MSAMFKDSGLPPEAPETYIGDGIYAKCDGQRVVLATDRIDGGTHWIVLERGEMSALQKFWKLWTESA